MYSSSSGHQTEEGFTLVELLVVILIIGILSAIAIPAFINQRKSASEASVKSDLKNAANTLETTMVSQKTYPKSISSDVKTSDGVSLTLADRGKSLTVKSTSSTVHPEPVNITWGVDSKGPFFLPNYEEGKNVPNGSFYYFAEFFCDGVRSHAWRSGIGAIKITTDPKSWDSRYYIENWKCPAGTKDSSVTIQPQANGTDLSYFDKFTLSTKSIGSNIDGFCIQGSHASEVNNVWKYDSANGGLQKGAC